MYLNRCYVFLSNKIVFVEFVLLTSHLLFAIEDNKWLGFADRSYFYHGNVYTLGMGLL